MQDNDFDMMLDKGQDSEQFGVTLSNFLVKTPHSRY